MTIALMAVAALMGILVERRWPASALPKVEFWWGRVVLVNAAQLMVVLVAGITWDRWFGRASIFHISQYLNPIGAGLAAYLVSCFVYYWWHRYRHESKFFWRVCHQLHHSPRRIELLTSFYKHPVEIALNSFLSSAIVFGFLGCDLRAAGVYTLFIGLAEYFYHLNIRTPRWVGYILQRPESHRIHHQFQQHTMNYGDLPILDWMFGTLVNAKHRVECGFTPQKEAQFTDMLLFREVNPNRGLAPTCFGCRKRWICQRQKAGTEK